MANVPVGFRFHPTDEELIRHYLYLKNKVIKGPAEEEAAAVVPEVDLYGETEPWRIWEAHGGADLYDQDLFFFTKLKKVNPHGTRINRKIGTGTWSEGEPSRPIFVGEKKNKTPIGRKRKFRYENKSSDHHGCWYMEEYSLDGIKSADYVICRLRENNRSGGGGTGGNRDSLAISVAASMEASGPIPVGFRFHPTDQELICYFLYNKNKGKGGRGLAMFMAEEAEAEAEEEKIKALPAAEGQAELPEDKNNTNEKEGQAPPPEVEEKKNNGENEAAAVVPVEEEEKKKDKGKEKKTEGEMQAAPLLLLEYMKDNQEDETLLPREVEVGKKENMFLHEFDLFGSTEPWEIWEMFRGAELCNQDLFFFTQLKKVNPKGSRIGRKVGSGGTWSEGDVSKPIVDDRTGNPIGRKRKLRYEKVGSPHHACWYLDEYSLLDADIGDYVICRLRKNDKLAAAAFSSAEAVNNRKRKATPSTTPATAEESKQPPTAAEESKQPPATAEESQALALATAEESKQPPATAEESKQEEDSSKAKRRRITGLTQVEEAAADVLMNMANSTLNHNTLKLFGIEIGSTPIIGGE
uniref:uncharacterized protein LOC105352211 n=1 Tax=Fragaria vesca subsp. vesca TaxID=101020 RepID=UPI0005CA01BD|nr:PREDICTED: uncharacterized protein LOC105352211 [Fragaria vesca subsp. vesca]